jgi:nucleoid-associated protein YgaU
MFTASTVSGTLLLLFCLTMFGPIAPPHAIEIKANAPEQYVVKPGDTLWDIASVYLAEAWQWPKI